MANEPVVINPAGSARLKCLPTYLVLDTSNSMSSHAALLNDSLRSVHRAAYHNPQISAFAHMSIISFNTQAHLALPMTDIRKVTRLPVVACSGLTEYARAFNLIRERIDVDVPALSAQNRRVLRPAVFFMTDGAPSDGAKPGDKQLVADNRIWQQALNNLVDPAWERRPHIITFGFGQANERVLAQVATLQAFVAADRNRQDESLRKVFASLVSTLAASAGSGGLQLPNQVEGFRNVPLETIS